MLKIKKENLSTKELNKIIEQEKQKFQSKDLKV